MALTDGRMDVDMDIDLTLDSADDPEIARLRAEAAAFDAVRQDVRDKGIGECGLTHSEQPGDASQSEAMNGVEEPIEEGEVDADAFVPKMHVRGVDSFRPSDVENYAGEHFSTDLFKKVEWIDDTSLNLSLIHISEPTRPY